MLNYDKLVLIDGGAPSVEPLVLVHIQPLVHILVITIMMKKVDAVMKIMLQLIMLLVIIIVLVIIGDALKELNKMFAEAMATMSASFVQVADSMGKSIEQLANMNTQMMSRK